MTPSTRSVRAEEASARIKARAEKLWRVAALFDAASRRRREKHGADSRARYMKVRARAAMADAKHEDAIARSIADPFLDDRRAA